MSATLPESLPRPRPRFASSVRSRWRPAFVGDHGKIVAVALVVLGTLLAIAIRLPLLGYESGDYRTYIGPWYDYLQRNGLGGLGDRFSDYTPPYLYLLAAATYLQVSKLLAVKLLSVGFDFLLATAAARLTARRHDGPLAPAAAYVLVLLTPTVVANSAAWGQCDAIYAAFVVLSIGYAGKRNEWAMLAFGIALAFKAQAIFIAPLFVILALRGQLPVRCFFIPPLVYVAAIVPAWLLGRPFGELLLIYREQSGYYEQLTLGAPTMYAWFPNAEGLAPAGILFAMVLVGIFVLACWKKLALDTDGAVVSVATAALLLVPFVLPRMHERYFFAADVISVVYAFYFPRRFLVPVLVIGASFGSYLPYLAGIEPLPLPLLAGFVAAALALVLVKLFRPRTLEANAAARPAGNPAKAAAEGLA